jgi:hypothetical protein
LPFSNRNPRGGQAAGSFRVRVLSIQNSGIQESIFIANLSGMRKANSHDTDLLLLSHTDDLIGATTRYDSGRLAAIPHA